MMKILYKTFKIFLAITLLFIYSCSEDTTPSLADLPSEELPTPVLTSIDPPDFGLAGVTVVTITGSNFSTSTFGNLVFFNGISATVLSATSTQIKVIAPNLVADTVVVKMAGYKSENFSNSLNYKLEPAVSEYYVFNRDIPERPYGICTDHQDNVYVSVSNITLGLGIKKIMPGVVPYIDFAPKGGETFFKGLAITPDNTIYGARGLRGIFKIVENTAPATFVSSSNGIADNVTDVDYDAARDVLWGGGTTGILYKIGLDKNVKKFNINGIVSALRVAGNDLFVATRTDNEEIVWRVPIVNADSLGTAEQYFNFSTSINIALKIADIVLSEDGDLYIGTDATSDPIYVVHQDKSFEVFYPGLIDSKVYAFSWGYGNILYMTNIDLNSDNNYVNTTLLKIDMQKSGAH